MSTRRMAITVCTIVVAGVTPGPGARDVAQGATLFSQPKAPYSERFTVPPPKTGTKSPQVVVVEVQPTVQGRVRESPVRIACGMKVIEGNPDVDPRIVIPIPEGHNARIRVIGRPPCGSETVAVPERR